LICTCGNEEAAPVNDTRRISGGDAGQGIRQRPPAIVLIGMPGSGKSTLGRRIANELNREFLDTDVLIEEYERRPITEIFKADGEAYFRRLESLVIETVRNTVTSPGGAAAPTGPGAVPAPRADRRGLILSVGGGAAEHPDNVALLRETGFVVFIDRPLEALEKSIAYNGNRPLLSDREKLVEQYERRAPLYAKAADGIISNDGDFEIAVEELLRTAKLLGAEDDYLLIGDPVAHSLSPMLHAILFAELRKQGGAEGASFDAGESARRAAGAEASSNTGAQTSCDAGETVRRRALLNASYSAVRVPPECLESSIGALRAGTVKGLNVTIPHKKKIIPFLDGTRGDAALAGAVNTVVREGDKLIGYNTDMEGLRLALETRGRTYAGAVVTVCGTGGAAAGVVSAAAACGAAKIYLLGRNEEAASRLSADRAEFVRHDFAETATSPRLDKALAETDILINATPLGMDGTGLFFADVSFIEKLPVGAFVYDLVYKPVETELVRAARGRGLGAESGLSMLVFQGILSDELFFGVETDRRALYEAARDKVYNNSIAESDDQ
jgi:shikimate dehydrogenase